MPRPPERPPTSDSSGRTRRHIAARGVVQGVGFRPFVFTLAERFGLAGFVGNDSSGVFIEVEGRSDAVEAFLTALRSEAPALARIDAIEWLDLPTRGDVDFRIVVSHHVAGAATLVAPDAAVCADCLRESLDPQDRRFRYPFANCTHCGPRFTIIRDIPYDRAQTTMRDFALCAECAREYADPRDRRFHAEPIACPRCGPQLRWHADGARGEAALDAARRALAAGRIVAVKGIGGFHLACNAVDAGAVARLRERKRRSAKPFAVMVRDVAQARAVAHVDVHDERLLRSPQAPIVLLRRLREPELLLAPDVAPNLPELGVLLPYSPLHRLLVDDGPLVMTSGNRSDEPICRDDDEALHTLAGIADDFLLHDREIHMWCDDSVVRIFRGHELPIRRSRGYAPYPVRLSGPQPTVLAVGGELKATFCLTRDDHAFMSQHIGDMENLATLQAFERAVQHFVTVFHAHPALVACDAHPGYLSTQWAERFAASHGLPLRRVQHHHAHVAAALAEHRRPRDARVIGLVCDGAGYGDDGAVWGCEVLAADCFGYERLAHLRYAPLPGGDAAVRHPFRSALAHLWDAGIAWDEDVPPAAACDARARAVLRRQLEQNIHCARTSSLGRLFDALASLLDVRHHASYEAQAAIELQSLAERSFTENTHAETPWDIPLDLDARPLIRAALHDLRAGVDRARIARRAHLTIARMLVGACAAARERTGLETVVVSGGAFQNTLLLGDTLTCLRAQGFETLQHHVVPTSDGGLALGQAVIAGSGAKVGST